MSLQALGRKKMVISTFGNGSRKQSCEVIKATLETREERLGTHSISHSIDITIA